MFHRKFSSGPLGPALLGFCSEAACGSSQHWAAAPGQGSMYARAALSSSGTDLPSPCKIPKVLKTRVFLCHFYS